MRALAAVTVFGVVWGAGCAAPPPAVPPLPPPHEVEKVTATVFGVVSDQPDLAEFDIPPAFVPDLLRILSPAEYHRRPPAKADDIVAVLRVVCRDGRAVDVEVLYSLGQTVQFTVQGVPCRRTGTYADLDPVQGVHLPEVLSIEAFLRAVRQGQAGRARAALDRRDRSAGR